MRRNLLVELAGGVPFGAASLVRGKRIFHPRGVAFTGDLEVGASEAARGLAPHGNRQVTVRVSNGAGLPGPLPDVRGFAIRIRDAHGRGRDQDLVLATGAPGIALRNALLPTTGIASSFFSSILPYRLDGRVAMLGASPEPTLEATSLEELAAVVSERPVEFHLHAASLLGRWERFGSVVLRRPLSARESASLRFNPWNTGEAVRPFGILNALRDPAYRWSQAARRIRGERAPGSVKAAPRSRVERVPISG